jgi:ABC-type Na+ efflux pump permease subunit
MSVLYIGLLVMVSSTEDSSDISSHSIYATIVFYFLSFMHMSSCLKVLMLDIVVCILPEVNLGY